MLKKLPLQIRLTILTIILLTTSCTLLTIILNVSANKMAVKIEAASTMSPAQSLPQGIAFTPSPTLASEPYLNPTAQAISMFNESSIIYMLVIILSGGALTYYVVGKSLKPLKDLNSQMKEITVHNLSEELAMPNTEDEISELTNSFNDMRKKLNDAFLIQGRFSANAAHELRTPLAVLKTRVDVFKKRNNHTKEEYDKLIKIIEKHTDRLSDIVKNLLDISNMEEICLNDSIDLNTLIEDIYSDLSSSAKEKEIKLTIDGENSIILGNYDLIRSAFFNLIENGIKYNNIHGSVNTKITKLKDYIEIEISDTGIGIPDDMKDSVFEPFFCVDKSRSRQIGGAGIGLSIVKKVIEKHNGKILITNNKDYIGTSVIIRLKTLKNFKTN
ncbi:HAMP domain-containing histidine kinase [Clostridium perfringens]|nr:HAMP domain-containing histidine kinase [Clostridium perfringens]